jgi:two-component system C4-dicarboxylate transport sensor histidine kinase DctB
VNSDSSQPGSSAHWMELGRLAELGLLSATLVHELRQPLFAIKSLLQVHRPAPDDAGAIKLQRTLMEQVLQMEAVLRAAGGLVQRPGDWDQPFCVEQPVKAAFEAMAPGARKLGVSLELVLPPSLPMMRGNPVAMQQVLTNLIRNSLDAVTEVESPRVVLTAEIQDDAILLTLSDNGSGISPDQQQRIFEPFFTTKPPGHGTGLGLSIARKLVRMARGTMDVCSGGGETRISLRYPLGGQAR